MLADPRHIARMTEIFEVAAIVSQATTNHEYDHEWFS
jgi:hypothetical protein